MKMSKITHIYGIKILKFLLKEGVHVTLYFEEANLKQIMFQKMFRIYKRIKDIQLLGGLCLFDNYFLMLPNTSDQRITSFYNLDIHKKLSYNTPILFSRYFAS